MGGGGEEGTWSYPMALWSPLSHVRLNVAEELISPLANKTPKPCSSWPKEEQSGLVQESGMTALGSQKAPYEGLFSSFLFWESTQFENRGLYIWKKFPTSMK